MTKLKVLLSFVGIGIGLSACQNVADQIPPPMTQVSVQICGNQIVRNQTERTCLSHTAIYWGKLSQKDIKLIEMKQKNRKDLNYYFVTVSAAGCVADWKAPRPQVTDIVAIKSIYSDKVSGKPPEIKILNLVEVAEEKRKLLVEETEEKLAFATLMGSQTSYTQPSCQNFRQIENKLKARGYNQVSY